MKILVDLLGFLERKGILSLTCLPAFPHSFVARSIRARDQGSHFLDWQAYNLYGHKFKDLISTVNNG